MNKICKKCHGTSVQKFGKSQGRQRYKCMQCGYIFRSPRRIQQSKQKQKLFQDYSLHKQTLRELADNTALSVKTIHRKISFIFQEKTDASARQHHIRLHPNLSTYTSSVLILDATFFGKKGSHTQWGILVAIDGISGDVLASKHIFQETKNDYDVLLSCLASSGYPPPLFAVIDGRPGVQESIHTYYTHTPVQICQAHKIATIDRYLLKFPRIESYQILKALTHEMVHTDTHTFFWGLQELREKYNDDFRLQELDTKTMKEKYVHPRLRRAYHSLMRDKEHLFVYADFIRTIQGEYPHLKNPIINTTNRIESIFSHVKQKVKIHRGLIKERRLSLALSLLWKE